MIERIYGLDAVVEQLVENERYTGTARELIQGQIVRVTVDDRSEFICELGDNGKNDVALQRKGTSDENHGDLDTREDAQH